MPLPAEGIWAVLEIMGHRRLAGLVREETIAGAVMLRVDIPGAAAGDPDHGTQYYGGASLFCMTPTSEDLARLEANPPAWPPTSFQLPAPASDQEHDDEEPEV